MKKLDANAAFSDNRDLTRDDGLLDRIADSLTKAGIAHGYYALQPPKPGQDTLFVCHENGRLRTYLHVDIKKGEYSIIPDKSLNKLDKDANYDARTPMEPAQLDNVSGTTGDYNAFIGALEYVFSYHYPSAVESGKLTQVMDKFKRSEEPRPNLGTGLKMRRPSGVS